MKQTEVSIHRPRTLQCSWTKILAAALLLLILVSPGNTIEERFIQVPALKRIVPLGDLYNEKTDTFIPVGVFRRTIPTEFITEIQNPDKQTYIEITDSLIDQFNFFNIDKNTGVNILTGITKPQGALSLLKNGKTLPLTETETGTGTLLFKYQTIVQNLQTFQDGLKDIYNKDVMGHIEATHVVTKILWGCQVAVQIQVKPKFFPTKKNDTHNIRKLIKAELRNLREKPTASDQLQSNFSMTVTSDVPLPLEIPTTGQEVKELLSQVPSLVRDTNGGKGIPLSYTLTPINLIRKHLGVTVQNTTPFELNKFTLYEIIEVFQHLQSVQAKLHRLNFEIKSYSNNCISEGTESKLLELQSKFRNFKNNFTTTVKTCLIQVRSGLMENTVLSDLVENFWEPDFQLQNLRQEFESFNPALEKIEFCRDFQNSFSHIRYFGATTGTRSGGEGEGLINSLAKSENNSQSPIFILFTKFEYVQNEPAKYTDTLALVLRLLKGNGSQAVFVDCDFPQQPFCKDINETSVYKYQNGSISAELQLKSSQTIIPTCSLGFCLNGGTCNEKGEQIFCKCAAGFIGDNCEDIECAEPGTCSAALLKPPSCKCRPGFLKDLRNPGKCSSTSANNNATLLYSDNEGIQQYSISQSNKTRIVSDNTVFRALDFHYRTERVFWGALNGKLYSAPVFAGDSKTILLTDTSGANAFYSISVDWIHALLYCTDASRNQIFVVNLDGSMKKVVISEGLSYPTSIAVNPLNGWMYWVSSNNRKIEHAGMDGSRRETIATTNSDLAYGLTLDYTQNRLYWITWKPHPCSIYSMNLDGSDLKLVLRAAPPILHASSFGRITIVEDYMYWRDDYTHKIYRANKCNGIELTELFSATGNWKGIQVYHFSKQPEVGNQCDYRSLRCSHLCLPIPGVGNETVSTICACPDGHTLSSNGHTCS